MKETLRFNIGVGAFLTLITYVTGFTWQYSYLGVITNDIGWVKIVTSDYIHLGGMAILFIIEPWALGFLIVMLCLALSGMLDKGVVNFWNSLSFKGKLKFQWLFSAFDSSLGRNSGGKMFVAYLMLVLLSVNVILEITEVSAQHMAQRLMSDGVDRVCDQDKNCLEGKVLYIGDKQIYFYNFNGEEEVTEGVLTLVSVADWTVSMGWNEQGRELISNHIAAGS